MRTPSFSSLRSLPSLPALPAMPGVPAMPPLKVLGRWLIVAALVFAAIAAGYLLWLRDSSLVSIDRVEVRGAESEPEVEAALVAAAEEMTTLHVDQSELLAAVAEFPAVLSLSTDRDFPHGLAIAVDVRRPVGYLESGGGTIVAADGVVLETGGERPEGLPLIEVDDAVAASRAEGSTLALSRVLGGAPEVLLPKIDTASLDEKAGPVVSVGAGIELRFGSPAQAEEKWAAAAAVLADPALDDAAYIDLSVPSRPVVG